MRLLGVLSASTALLALVGAAEKPKVTKQDFDFPPQSYFYFEESSVILSLEQETGKLWRSADGGEKWTQIKDIEEGDLPWDIYQHPFDKMKVYVLTLGMKHYKSDDQGNTWKTFETEMNPTYMRVPLSHHATKKEYVLFTGMECMQDPVWRDRIDCYENTFYTKDWFESKPVKLLDQQTHACMFSRSTTQFNEGPEDTILCIVDGSKAGIDNWILLTSSDFFVKEKQEPFLDGFRTISGVTGIAAVQKFILVAAKGAGTDEMSLFVSDDAVVWDRAEFPSDHGGLKQDAYTILESTPESIQVDVLTTNGNNAIGALFTSNSNGTYFTRNIDHTNRNLNGNVDFEQVAGIEGIVLVNIVDNAEDVLKGNGNNNILKKIKSQISFDGGRTFKDLTTNNGNLHVHSITDARNAGRVFSSPAPGILMAIGNTGKYLSDYKQGNLYISNDAGLNWEKTALDGPHYYEFGDSGSILVAIADGSITNTLSYSVNHGRDWESVDLGLDVQVVALLTVPDSSSKKFTMIAVSTDLISYIFSFNFDGVLDRQCKKLDDEKESDYEKWYARLDDNQQPDCLMGHKQYFWRRKQDSLCFVNNEFEHPVAEEEDCPCTDEDYECDFEFAYNTTSDSCELIGKLKIPVGACKNEGEKFEGPSGYRLIPDNTCKKDSDHNKDDKIEWDCNRGKKSSPPPPGGIRHVINKVFNAEGFREYYYLGNDTETIVARTNDNRVFVTKDQGGTWEEPKELKGEEITAIYPNQYQSDIVFFTTTSAKYFYTVNRFDSIKEESGPDPPTSRQDIPLALRFHPKSDYIIWISDRDCEGFNSKACHAAAYYTTGRGKNWLMLSSYVRNCAWIHSDALLKTPEKLVFCEKYAKDEGPSDTNPMKLISSNDFFRADETVHFEKVMGFATMEEFILAAEVKDDSSLRLHASLDGSIFAEAKFPHSLNVDKQQAYTLLDSVTHAIFLHVTVNSIPESEYGALIKSNSNGTSYVLSLNNVNRNGNGFVDFEKMQGLEGVAIVNVVANVDEANRRGRKKLKSMITHNDGGVWGYLQAPSKDFEGEDYKCDVKEPEKCSLHLHGYTERKDPRDTFSSGSAVGLLVGVGNVGEYLTSKSEGNTYLTRDAGINWKEIRKGSYMWEYGDQGSIIVLVDENEPTDTVFYTLDEGENWHDYNFGEKIYVLDITTIPSDTSRKFLLWGRQGGKAITVQIDFTQFTEKKCELKEDPNESDFELWEPTHPSLDAEHSCLFGHHVQYPRKKPDRVCYIGTKRHDPIESEKCACERHDYECDFNYELQAGNKCVLVAGLQAPNHETVCANNKSLTEWYEPTGYRRVPITKCVGETKWDKGRVHPCPGHGASGWVIFFSVLVSLGAAGGIGWYVWNRWSGKFGAIRLGDDLTGGQSPLVRYPIIAISALVAVVVAIPAVVQVVVGWVASKLNRPKRYTTRGSFARGDYAVVENDDGELLGSDDEDEV